MRRVLFVDDEPRVLRGLERSLYRMRGEWEMRFVESGEQALALMGAAPFDVVITDMRMPGMNGAELLGRVKELYPHTVRLVLSGFADTDLVLRCVGAAHQYLAKPCDPSLLAQTVTRATAMAESLQSGVLRRILSRLELLPSIPTLYLEILEKAKDPDAPLEEIARIVGRDIGMTAKILKLVNSAFFGLSRVVADPQTAVSYLGVETVKSLVLGLSTFARFGAVRVQGFSLDELWVHSLQTAAAARAITRAEGRGTELQETAFTAGLLHDAGKLVLAGNLPEEYAAVMALVRGEGMAVGDAERRVVEATHAEVGGYLLGLWGLPDPVVEAILLHHEPGSSRSTTFRPLVAVHAANALLRGGGRPGDGPPEPGLDGTFLRQGGWLDRLPAWRAVVRATVGQEAPNE